MRVYKDKQYLVFDYEDGRTVKYDFATKTAIGIKGKPVKNLCSQLSGFTLDQLFESFDDKQYTKFLRYIKAAESENYRICNIGTILDRVPRYSKFEQIFSAGIDQIIIDKKRFTYSLNEIPKSLIKICREYDIKISSRMIGYYKENPDAHYVAFSSEYMSLDKEDIFDVWTADTWRNGDYKYQSYFNILIMEFGYNAKKLYLYLDRLKTLEAINSMHYLIRELYDYANMMRQLSDKYDKYPRHFLTTHQIAIRNYQRMKKEFSEEMFKKRINKQYECSFGNYTFVYPNSTQDIKDEAVQMSNCVSSYIDKVINGECHILFLRKKDSPDKSLVTIEVRNNQIVQARRKFNDPVNEEEQKVIDAFNNKFAKVKENAA